MLMRSDDGLNAMFLCFYAVMIFNLSQSFSFGISIASPFLLI